MEGSHLYNVSVNGSYVGLYNDRNFWGGLVHFGMFEFENGREITLRIRYYKPFKEYEILPIRQLRLLKVNREDRQTISITLDKADQNITVVIDGELQKHVLHLFCNSIDEQMPQMTNPDGYHVDEDRRLIYFGPGYYDTRELLGQDLIQVHDGWRLYIAPGAVVNGCVGLWNTHKGTRVDGRGMLFNDTQRPRVIFELNDCEGADASGVLFHCHRPSCWQVVVNHCRNVEFKGIKILSARYASTDGLDIVNCQQCAFLNCFIRSSDDAVAIKGLDTRKPAECPPNRNLTFCGLQTWNDCNCALGIGAENHCALYENIRFMNTSVLYNYDDPDYHEVLDERAALAICCIHGTYFNNISYENIDVYHCQRLIAAGFQPDFWFGSLPGDQTTEGGITDLRFVNVSSPNNSGSRIANKIHLYGWNREGTPEKWVDGVTFEEVKIEGRVLKDKDDKAFSETEWERVKNVKFL